jgi:hypothetical protein
MPRLDIRLGEDASDNRASEKIFRSQHVETCRHPIFLVFNLLSPPFAMSPFATQAAPFPCPSHGVLLHPFFFLAVFSGYVI